MVNRLLYLIDDDDAARDSTSFLLDVKGYRVESFASAEDFLEAVPDPQVPILADVLLPGISGLQLLEKLRSDGCHVPIALISAHANEDVKHRAGAAGAVCLLQKPIAPKLLLETVERCFELAE
jgi:FixJ family two-component response regulator